MSRSTGSFFSFLAGLATGAVLGILYAPDKGEVTRDKLGEKLGKYREQLEEFIAELIERGDEVAVEMAGGENVDSKAKAEGKKVVNEARQKAEKLLEDVENLMSQIKSKA
ncbi:YtxH domain-containing protein [Jiulongibacter sediminis]|uniref:Gas vesicle protein n=1 Tax=Jiulongibacter sediminis TaxID=1605367 RepID=A0A0P7C3R0_9BACT|nr:YtxH domain-containing protein [Jiulongibacter sediminis]KPM49283.1 gas vesicle protein [Jiulongibacter sediminis]TBX26336.1 gas vesicle protein [Jiulongibacter sediminis]